MVSIFPKGLYTMEQRYAIIRENAKRYREGSKKVKGQILDELEKILDMNRQYLSFLLRNTGRKVVIRDRGIVLIGEYSKRNLSSRGRKKLYDEGFEKILLKVWAMSGFISSKHLSAFIRLNSDILFSHPELEWFLDEGRRDKLLKVSPATIDRLLKRDRDIWEIKKRYRGNPFSSNLKRSIQVESWFDRKREAGDVEIDLVHHCGDSAFGQFIYTLTATEILTGWTELVPLRNKAMVWAMDGLIKVKRNMPVKIKKIHSDNGSEFINSYILRFCKGEGIEFKRSRAYRKNDNPFVESKNWTMVRAYTGWRRYDTEEEYQILKKLVKLITLRHNLFLPQMKIKEKERIEGKIRKRYEMDIPINRVLKIKEVDEATKKRLVSLRNNIDIVKLTTGIAYLREKLEKVYQTKRNKQKCLVRT